MTEREGKGAKVCVGSPSLLLSPHGRQQVLRAVELTASMYWPAMYWFASHALMRLSVGVAQPSPAHALFATCCEPARRDAASSIRVCRIPPPEEPPCRRASFHYNLGEQTALEGRGSGTCAARPVVGETSMRVKALVSWECARAAMLCPARAGPRRSNPIGRCHAHWWVTETTSRQFAATDRSTRCHPIFDRASCPCRSARRRWCSPFRELRTECSFGSS